MRDLSHSESSDCESLNMDIYQHKAMENILPNELLLEYKQAFQMLDRKRTGKITMRDLATVLCSIGMHLSGQELFSVVTSVIGAQDNFTAITRCITFNDFLSIMATIATDCVSEDEIQRIFREFDKDGDGFISPKELRELLCRLGDDISEADLQEMIREADQDGDGMVSLDEFIQVMTSAALMDDCAGDQSPTTKDSTHDLSVTGTAAEKVTAVEELPGTCCDEESCSSSLDPPKPCSSKRKSSFGKRRKSIVDWLKGKASKTVSDTSDASSPDYISSGSCSSASDLESSLSLSTPRKRRSSVVKTLQVGLRSTVMRTRKSK